MVHEAEEFTTEYEAQEKRIESLNSLQELLSGALSHKFPTSRVSVASSNDDKKTILAAIKEATEWVGQTATSEELDEKLSEVQTIVQLIMRNHYEGGAGGDGGELPSHDEL